MSKCLLLASALVAVPAFAGPLQITNAILVERHVAAPDGTTRIVTAAGARARPGDRMVVSLAYRNTGRQPIADLVLADPVPAELAYRAPSDGSPLPELSVDGRRFAALSALSVAVPGGSRAATLDDVVAVRWRLSAPLAPGAGGTLAFRAVLK